MLWTPYTRVTIHIVGAAHLIARSFRFDRSIKILFRTIILLLVIGGIGAAGYYGYVKVTAVAERTYKTAPVKRGGLVQTITATGTVEPEEVVDIGAQVAGQINTF